MTLCALAVACLLSVHGAPVPFIEYQAEGAATDGVRLAPSRAFGTLASEASGRSAVRLARGGYVEFTLRAPADAVDVRYSVADAADVPMTIEIDRVPAKTVMLTARYSWFYGGYPFTNRPGDGAAHHFYDDVRTLLGATVPAGSRVRLVAGGAAVVDLADFEDVGPPSTRPAGALSVVDFGADPTGARDSTAALQTAIDAGQTQRKPVWIPPGTFQVNGHLIVDDVTLEGAGPWYSTLHGVGVGVYGRAAPRPSSNVRLAGFAIVGEVTGRDDRAQVNGIGGALGGGSVISNLWIEHTKVGMWLDGPFDGLTITGCRIQDVTADGINLHAGVSHVTIEDTLVRNSGDDGIALWSDASFGAPGDRWNVVRFNTVELPILANNVALYGGSDNSVTDNVLADTVTEGGAIHVGNRFSSAPLAGVTTIARNTAVRTGSFHPGLQTPVGALWFYAKDAPLRGRVDVTDTTLVDSTYAGVQFYGSSVVNVSLTRLRIEQAGTFAVQVQATGSARLAGVTAVGLGAAGVYICSAATPFRLFGAPAGFGRRYCGPFPKPRHR